MAKVADYAPASLGDLGKFLDADEKAAMVGVALTLLSITDDPGNRFGPRWIVSVADNATGEKYALGFAHNVTRDRSMRAMLDAIEAGETFDPVAIEKVSPEKGGNPFWIVRDATDQEIAETAEAKAAHEAAAVEGQKLSTAKAKAGATA